MFTICKAWRHSHNIQIFDHYDDNTDLIDKKMLKRSRLQLYEQDLSKVMVSWCIMILYTRWPRNTNTYFHQNVTQFKSNSKYGIFFRRKIIWRLCNLVLDLFLKSRVEVQLSVESTNSNNVTIFVIVTYRVWLWQVGWLGQTSPHKKEKEKKAELNK